tara:strand:- start:159 stop:779 length:621 start_codon:yes stop_codon:yes gene_type:complete
MMVWQLSGLETYLTFDSISENYQQIDQAVSQNYFISMVIFFIVYLMIAASCLPGLGLLSFMSGLLFGFLYGTLICSFASTIGAAITFLISRHFLRDTLEKRLKERFEKINRELTENGKFYLLSIRLLPILPFQLINPVLGLSKVSLKDFYLYSQLGMLPVTAILTYAGAKSVEIKQVSDIFTPPILSALFLMACVPLLGRIYKAKR